MITVDRLTITQIIGCLMQEPSLLSETDKYRLEMEDFRRLSDKYIFSAIYNLYVNGAGCIHTIDIVNALKDNVTAYDLIEKENGLIFLQDSETNANLSNFNYYYNRLKKINLIIDLQKAGHDTSSIYCEDLLSPDRNKINDKFERLSISDILNNFKKEITKYEEKYNTNTVVSESYANEGIEELLEELKSTPEVGCTLQGEIFNTVCRGGRKGKLYIRSASSGLGKAIPNYTKIPTPNGWTTVGEVNVGDYLFDRNGNPTKVLAVYPQSEKKRIYKVYFQSGRIAECCDEHLWSYYDDFHNKKLVTKTLKEMYEEMKFKDCFFEVPIIERVKLPERKLPIDPYTKGFTIEVENSISDEYLFSSEKQRLELLQGLLDLNGHFNSTNGQISYITDCERLKNDFVNLVSSLGFFSITDIEHKEDEESFYRINLIIDDSIKPNLFKLSSKGQAVIDYLENRCREWRKGRKTDLIVKIEETGEYADMTCFYIDNEEHLFAMNDWCITHNTRNMVADAANLAYPIRFDNYSRKWVVSNPNPEKVLYIMTEQDPEEIKTMLLSYLTGISEEVFLYGAFNEKEKPRIKIAIELMNKFKDNMIFAHVPDPCASVIKNLFRKYNLQYNVENFFFDYIFSSPAMLDEYRDLGLREEVCLRMFSTTLKNLAVELNAFIQTSTQISNDEQDDGGFKDYHNIRGAKAIADVADLGCIMQRPTVNELTLVNSFCQQSEYTPNLITDIYKNRRGRYTMCRVWSYINLGTLRKTDLFITTNNNKPIEDFAIMNIKYQIDESLQDYVDELNENTPMIELDEYKDDSANEIIDNFEEVFDNSEAMKKQLNELEIDDLI